MRVPGVPAALHAPLGRVKVNAGSADPYTFDLSSACTVIGFGAMFAFAVATDSSV